MSLTKETANRKDLRTGVSPMQHRHYTTVAAIIRIMPEGLSHREIALHFARELRPTNPNFDEERFLRACKPS